MPDDYRHEPWFTTREQKKRSDDYQLGAAIYFLARRQAKMQKKALKEQRRQQRSEESEQRWQEKKEEAKSNGRLPLLYLLGLLRLVVFIAVVSAIFGWLLGWLF